MECRKKYELECKAKIALNKKKAAEACAIAEAGAEVVARPARTIAEAGALAAAAAAADHGAGAGARPVAEAGSPEGSGVLPKGIGSARPVARPAWCSSRS